MNRREESLEKRRYDLFRMHAFTTVKPHLEKGSNLRVQQFWPLPWDDERGLFSAEEISEAENKKVFAAFSNWKEKGLIQSDEQ